MKHLLALFTFSGLLVSCATPPAVTGSLITPQGDVRVPPDGQVEIVVRPLSDKRAAVDAASRP